MGGLGAQDANTIHLAQVLEPTRQVDIIADTTELHLRDAAYVPSEHCARIDADADLQHRETQLRELGIQKLNGALLRQGGFAGLDLVVHDLQWSIPESKNTIAEQLSNRPAVDFHDLRHHRKISRKNEEEIPGVPVAQLLGNRCEVGDVREHDRHFSPIYVQPCCSKLAPDHSADHALGHEAGKALNAVAEPAEGVLKLADLLHA
mmetsp:Transcript_18870/g.54585  ORF Transcript_18870/g.54585 Transcript_18870/m.54585 type:complete len:205 (+) Transcript_18870:706-1320(+)